LFLLSQVAHAQVQVVTTGNNLINPTNPGAADVVIGSSLNGGTRHDASIMWWSNASADRISDTGDEFYLSVWATTSANIGLAAGVGQPSFFQGNLLVGQTTQTNTSYKLDVFGAARMNSVVVNTTGADFVFKPFYKLASLPELKTYIDLHHHLPGIASATEMQASGLDLGKNQIQLLQKVEELTLYLIDKDNENKQLQEQVDKQNEQLKTQEARIAKLEEAMKKLDE